MNSLNSIFIEGNLTKDPEAKQTSKGTQVTTLNVASNRYYSKGEEKTNEVSFFNVEFWAKQAEVCKSYLAKGRGVRIRGRLKEDRWQDADGKWQSRVKIVGEDIEFKPNYKDAHSKGESFPEPARGDPAPVLTREGETKSCKDGRKQWLLIPPWGYQYFGGAVDFSYPFCSF